MTPLKLELKPKLQSPPSTSDNYYDLVIIGGGPAGLTAAIYAGRAQVKQLLIEKMMLGGKASTAYHIENYPGFPDGISGLELSQKMSEQTKKLGLEISWSSCLSIEPNQHYFEIVADNRKLTCRAIIIASGTENSLLDVKGEKDFHGRGVSYCATCDGAFYQNKHVVVVGGGNSAIEEALFLTRYASKVSIVHRRDQLRADKILAERAMNHPKVYFFWHSQVEEIRGDKTVNEVIIKDLLSGKRLNIPTDGLFIYTGSTPNSEVVSGLVKLDDKGYIITDELMATSKAGIFAAGDVRAKSLRQIVTATGDGAIAAESARLWLEKLDFDK